MQLNWLAIIATVAGHVVRTYKQCTRVQTTGMWTFVWRLMRCPGRYSTCTGTLEKWLNSHSKKEEDTEPAELDIDDSVRDSDDDDNNFESGEESGEDDPTRRRRRRRKNSMERPTSRSRGSRGGDELQGSGRARGSNRVV